MAIQLNSVKFSVDTCPSTFLGSSLSIQLGTDNYAVCKPISVQKHANNYQTSLMRRTLNRHDKLQCVAEGPVATAPIGAYFFYKRQ